MASIALTHQVLQIIPNSTTSIKPKSKPKQSNYKTKASLQTITAPQSSFSDQFVLQLAESFEDSVSSSSSSSTSPLPLQKLRDNSSETLLATQWPSRKDEAFRFTDVSFIRKSQIKPVVHAPQDSFLSDIQTDSKFANFVIADGFVFDSLCDRTDLPDGVYAGSLSGLSSEIISERVFQFLGDFQSGDLFWSINGIGAPDLMVIYVPEGCKVEKPIHLRYFSLDTGNKESKELPVSNPRVLVLVEKGAEVGIVEEFVGREGNERYWANSVLEVVIGEGAKVSHSYLQNQSSNSTHVKWTTVRQESASEYKLVEVSTGGKLGRHNVHVQQFGPDTSTELVTLHLSVADQTQDLHSRIVLDYPRGRSQQLHKCIVAHSLGQAVFDGNVKVNRYAQQTDAGQLTRSLLLEPRATVNLKPNLQIIADNVKCSHGAAISDIEESQLFYFQARGIDAETARKALAISFGAEVIARIPFASIQEEVKHRVRELLDSRQQNISQ